MRRDVFYRDPQGINNFISEFLPDFVAILAEGLVEIIWVFPRIKPSIDDMVDLEILVGGGTKQTLPVVAGKDF